MVFREKLNLLLLRSGKNQQVVAEEMGLKSSLFSKWKAGVPPSTKSLTRLAEYFRVPFAVLADDDSDLDEFVEEEPAPYGAKRQATGDAAKLSELERRIKEHRDIAKVFIERGWPLKSSDLLTHKDLIEMLNKATGAPGGISNNTGDIGGDFAGRDMTK